MAERRTSDIFILYKPDTLSFRMGGYYASNQKRRTFSRKADSINYARKQDDAADIRIVHLHFPDQTADPNNIPYVVDVINPNTEP
jgi:hypothetical protein